MKNLAKMFRESLGGHDVQEVACGCTNLLFAHLSEEQFDARLAQLLDIIESAVINTDNFNEIIEQRFKESLKELPLELRLMHSSSKTKVHYCTCIPDGEGNCTCQQGCFKCKKSFPRNAMHFVKSKNYYICRECF